MPTMDSSDSQWELDKAVRAQRPANRNVSSAAVNLHPIELVRRRGPERDDVVTLTTVEPNAARADGTTEAAGFTVRTFKNGEFFAGTVPPEVTALQAQMDVFANARRQAEAEEKFFQHDQIISADRPIPTSVLTVCANHPRGQWLANYLGRHPEACEDLLLANEISPEIAMAEAIKRAESLDEDQMADAMTHAEFCAWRSRKRQEAGLEPKRR
jgi:hypothetical protein